MKTLVTWLSLMLLAPLAQSAAQPFSLALHVNIHSSNSTDRLLIAESSTRASLTGDIYGELQAAFRLSRRIYLWGAFGANRATFVLNDGTPVMHSWKTIASGGLGLVVIGYERPDQVVVKIQGGVAHARFADKSGTWDIDLTKTGYRAEILLDYVATNHLFYQATVGFMSASSEFMKKNFRLGGFKIGVGAGLRF